MRTPIMPVARDRTKAAAERTTRAGRRRRGPGGREESSARAHPNIPLSVDRSLTFPGIVAYKRLEICRHDRSGNWTVQASLTSTCGGRDMRHAARILLVAVSSIAITGLLGAAPPKITDPVGSGPNGPGNQGVLAPASNLWFAELSSLPLSEALSSSASASDVTSYLADLHREKQDFRN